MPNLATANPLSLIRSSLKKYGLTAKEYAPKIGTDAFTVSRWLHEKHDPSPEFEMAIKEFYEHGIVKQVVTAQSPKNDLCIRVNSDIIKSVHLLNSMGVIVANISVEKSI